MPGVLLHRSVAKCSAELLYCSWIRNMVLAKVDGEDGLLCEQAKRTQQPRIALFLWQRDV